MRLIADSVNRGMSRSIVHPGCCGTPQKECLSFAKRIAENGRVIKVRKPGRPDAEQALVYQRLGIDWKRACPARKFVMK